MEADADNYQRRVGRGATSRNAAIALAALWQEESLVKCRTYTPHPSVLAGVSATESSRENVEGT